MNEVTGWHAYKGTTILQHKDVGEKLKDLFYKIKPKQVLEIGTSYGGLTLLIRDLLDEVGLTNTDFRTYDVIETERYWLMDAISNGAKIDLRIKNIFNHQYDDIVEVEEVQSFIQRDGVTIVLCDGGSKKNEFRLLSKYLKSGDIIMAHDYSPDLEYFEKYVNGKIWNWCEIQDSDIENEVKLYDLKPFMKEEFQSVVWVCKIKE